MGVGRHRDRVAGCHRAHVVNTVVDLGAASVVAVSGWNMAYVAGETGFATLGVDRQGGWGGPRHPEMGTLAVVLDRWVGLAEG